MLTTIQKLAASSLAAVRNALQKRCRMLELAKEKARTSERDHRPMEVVRSSSDPSDEVSEAEEELPASEPKLDLVRDEIRWLTELIELSRRVVDETKIQRLVSLVREEFKGEPVLLFTEYKATQALVVNALRETFGFETCAFINGDERLEGVRDPSGNLESWVQSRGEAARRFNAGEVRFLVSTEAGGEGIDLQERCSVMIHVDMPWNPMRLHQRVGRLSRYGQERDVRVRILRNPETVESRIWQLLEEKLGRVQEALTQTMEDPEDIAQLVIGMTENNVFSEIFSRAPDWEGERLSSWFDEKSAKLGGTDLIEAARTLAGNIARFDFRGVGRDLPQVDLPDLEEFVKGAVRRHDRLVRTDDAGMAFVSPNAWRQRNYAVRERYDSLVFDRRTRGPDAMARTLGVGHPVVDTALAEALGLDVRTAQVRGLGDPLLVISVEDQVTGTGAQSQRLVFGVREEDGEFVVRRDWELLKMLNERGARRAADMPATPVEVVQQYAGLVDEWSNRFDALHFGNAAGMRRPVAWPEMLLLPLSAPAH